MPQQLILTMHLNTPLTMSLTFRLRLHWNSPIILPMAPVSTSSMNSPITRQTLTLYVVLSLQRGFIEVGWRSCSRMNCPLLIPGIWMVTGFMWSGKSLYWIDRALNHRQFQTEFLYFIYTFYNHALRIGILDLVRENGLQGHAPLTTFMILLSVLRLR